MDFNKTQMAARITGLVYNYAVQHSLHVSSVKLIKISKDNMGKKNHSDIYDGL
jgi:hypothetical protein